MKAIANKLPSRLYQQYLVRKHANSSSSRRLGKALVKQNVSPNIYIHSDQRIDHVLNLSFALLEAKPHARRRLTEPTTKKIHTRESEKNEKKREADLIY